MQCASPKVIPCKILTCRSSGFTTWFVTVKSRQRGGEGKNRFPCFPLLIIKCNFILNSITHLWEEIGSKICDCHEWLETGDYRFILQSQLQDLAASACTPTVSALSRGAGNAPFDGITAKACVPRSAFPVMWQCLLIGCKPVPSLFLPRAWGSAWGRGEPREGCSCQPAPSNLQPPGRTRTSENKPQARWTGMKGHKRLRNRRACISLSFNKTLMWNLLKPAHYPEHSSHVGACPSHHQHPACPGCRRRW